MAFEWLEDIYEGTEDVALVGDILGSTAKAERRRANEERSRREREYTDLYNTIPHLYDEPEESFGAQAEADPYSIEKQREALALMSQAATGEYSDIDRARQQEMLQRNAIQERGQREAALAQMQARGMGRSGTQALSSMMAQQGSANRASQEGVNLEALAQQRALQAMNSMAGTAGQMRGQSFDERYRTGMARDDFNRRNSTARNEFQQQHFQNRQGVIDRKTGVYAEAGADAARREDESKERGAEGILALASLL